MLTHDQDRRLGLLIGRATVNVTNPRYEPLTRAEKQEMRELLKAETFGKRYSGLNDCDLSAGQHIDLEV